MKTYIVTIEIDLPEVKGECSWRIFANTEEEAMAKARRKAVRFISDNLKSKIHCSGNDALLATTG